MIARVTPLHAGRQQDLLNNRFLVAAAAGHLPAVRVLLDDGANINIRGANNETALACAAREGRLEMALYLIDAGASLDPQDKDGNTALAHAVRGNHVSIAARLIACGADITIENKDGQKPLDTALKSGVPALVALFEQPLKDLLARIPSADAVETMRPRSLSPPPVADPFGDTMLTWAAREGQDNVVRAMIQSGADIHQRNRAGDTARDVAQRAGHLDIVQLLEKAEHQPAVTRLDADRTENAVLAHNG